MTEALIFDCDGTLADTMPAHYKAWVDTLKPLQIVFPEQRFYALGGVPTVKISQILLQEAGKNEIDHLTLSEQKENAFLDHFNDVVAIEKVVAVARQGRGRVPMAVASGGQRAIVNRTLVHLGIADWFGAVVAAEDTQRHKPEPDVFLEAARRLGVAAEICTVYEDTDLGIEAARRAGMRFVDIRTM